MGTNWEKHSFETLHAMVHREDAARQRAAARGWIDLAQQFEALSVNITHYRESLRPHWDSAGGDAFLNQLTLLIGSIDAAARNGRAYADILADTAAAVVIAQNKMNQASSDRSAYLKEKDDYNNLLDDKGFWANTGDFFDDVGHNITGANDIDPAKLQEFDNRARAIMRELASSYLNAEATRPAMPQFKGPMTYQFVTPVMAVPSTPGMPGPPSVPLAGPPPTAPTMPTPVTPNVPVVPVPVVPVVTTPKPRRRRPRRSRRSCRRRRRPRPADPAGAGSRPARTEREADALPAALARSQAGEDQPAARRDTVEVRRDRPAAGRGQHGAATLGGPHRWAWQDRPSARRATRWRAGQGRAAARRGQRWWPWKDRTATLRRTWWRGGQDRAATLRGQRWRPRKDGAASRRRTWRRAWQDRAATLRWARWRAWQDRTAARRGAWWRDRPAAGSARPAPATGRSDRPAADCRGPARRHRPPTGTVRRARTRRDAAGPARPWR